MALLVLKSCLALNPLAGFIRHMDNALGQRLVHRLRENQREWLAGVEFGRSYLPARRVRRTAVRGRYSERFRKTGFQGIAGAILPSGVDDELVAFALLKGWPDLFERTNPAFDAARVDEQGQARHRRVPQL